MSKLNNLILDNLANYNYPAYSVQISDLNTDLSFGRDLFGRFAPSVQATNRSTDEYHYGLLMHAKAPMNLLGLASVIYWGYATFGDRYARNKVRWFLNGHGSVRPVTPEHARAQLMKVRAAIDRNEYGTAIGNLGSMGQLGRTPFASKVIAFMAPHGAGVYDNRIMKGIPMSPILSNAFAQAVRGVGAVSSPIIQKRYAAWCCALQELATSINESRPELKLRPLDVERAIFSATAGGRQSKTA